MASIQCYPAFAHVSTRLTCARHVHAHKSGKTFEWCREIAESINPDFKKQISEHNRALWAEILDNVGCDKLICKYTLKFLRRGKYVETSIDPERKSPR